MSNMAERREIDLRQRGIRDVPMLGRYEYRVARDGLPSHAHPQTLEVCYLAKGQQLYRVGARDYVLTGGDVFVTFPNETHSSGETPQEKGVLYWLQLRLSRQQRQLFHYPPAESRALIRQLLHLPHRHFAGDPRMPRLLDDVFVAAAGSADALSRVRIQNRLVDFLLTVIVCAGQQPSDHVSPAIARVLRRIDHQLDQSQPLASLARHAGLSLPRFKARFKAEVGIPPAEYVLRRRIDRAKAMLVRPDATVTRVAFDLGFSSSQYFATVFRRYTGQSPRHWISPAD